MKSMTGFGSGTATKDGITCTVEIKSVLFVEWYKIALFVVRLRYQFLF